MEPSSKNLNSFGTSTSFPRECPTSVEELRQVVRRANSSGQAIFPIGGGTMLDLGCPPAKPGAAVDLRSLNQVIDYPARDMTITVQAGITIAKLLEILRREKQQLPVDIPFPDRATLGGAIAANASGPRRYGLGTLRDYVIGISVVNDEGQEIKGGGRVVKNVAGYDLMKLYTGSLGTLGIITQVTLKLKPLPEAATLLALPASADQIGPLLDALHASRTRPVCIDLISPSACVAIEAEHTMGALPRDGGNYSFVIGFEDNFKAVAWQVEQLKKELPPNLVSGLAECSELERNQLSAALRDFQLWPNGTLTFKANLLPSAVADFCLQASALEPSPMLQAHAGNGIVIGHVNGLNLEQARTLLEKLGAVAGAARGNLIIIRCPPEWKPVLPIWGRSTGDRVMMKAIKAKLDPGNIFNPGRFVDGI